MLEKVIGCNTITQLEVLLLEKRYILLSIKYRYTISHYQFLCFSKNVDNFSCDDTIKSMGLTNTEILFLAVATAIIIAVFIYMKYDGSTTQSFEYDPNVLRLGANDSQQQPLSFESYKAFETFKDRNMNLHPSLMSTEQLEEHVSLSGLCMGPGLVEGNRFRGNLNI